MRTRMLYVLLAASLAFNLGFSGALAYKKLGCESQPAQSDLACASGYPAGFQVACDRLASELEPLRDRQAEDSLRLAEMLAAETADREEIARCLDRLAATARSIQGLVVDTVITQREMLPADQRAEFCSNVHASLCQPWGGCQAAAGTLCDEH